MTEVRSLASLPGLLYTRRRFPGFARFLQGRPSPAFSLLSGVLKTMTLFESRFLAQVHSEGLDPLVVVLGAIAAVVVLVVIVLLARRGKKAERPVEPEVLPPKDTAELRRAEASLERARKAREEAEEQVRAEQAARAEKSEQAKQRAEEREKARLEAEARAKAARDAAKAAETDEERKRAREEAARAEAQARKEQKQADEAARRAAYEEKKGEEAARRAKAKADEEAKRAAEVEAARQRAIELAQAEREKQRRIEAESGRTLAEGLAKTRGGFMARLASLVGATTELDDAFMGELEEILFTADIGPRTANRMLEEVREKLEKKAFSNAAKVRESLRREIENILTLGGTFHEGGMPAPTSKPQVVMIVGVNGSGKTTTLGKLSFKERVAGREVLLGAGDTFRAAAAEQLDVWAERAEVPLVKGVADADPASVCFDAVKAGVDQGKDLVLLDTAGRLHTQAPLMEELKKVKRVIDKAHPGAPHEIWLVVDGTTGQNGLMQARQFHEALGLTGLVLTKLDGTAKGGVVIGICDELKVPVRYVGVGEKIGDLRVFNPKEYVDALFAED